ncbi:4-(cytidine 5'-diphospho)-2-C-methyl-D-erythritol kinase [Fimbriiglobus ruber]|uniref:4-diphosphocytidyl-2-C-methyl-D-erythritol kinase n=1 Tax=Fimbriiglobus ruber TaxID=1908690 RepID=A0A225D319_9BACT|nr:4-(cytidine 5'-diphospho)-2-C-methyl-D-erythritol kinase [Fimbriiglobus ruber]OWK35990.1 4-diphosphocytidyl-2-C-methyl-D-erythritol kinase [Fimbriiglobus ruber]
MLSQMASEAPFAGGADGPFAGLPAGADARVVWAPAKVNLHLEILGKRADGYHAVETLILAIDLFDTLEVRDDPSGRLTLACDPPGLPTGPANLVYRAADALRRATGTTRGAAMRLVKRIPHEAGLGGGSSDAAAALAALNRLWGLNLTRAGLLAAAAEIGSDVGVFLSPPAGWCTGRGEVVEPETVGAPLHLVVVKPPVGLSTAEVYKRVTVPARPVNGDAVRAALRAGDAQAAARGLHNRLQEPAFAAAPVVESTYHRLAACGPLGCLLSGSGSSLFAVCRDGADAVRVATEFRVGAPPNELSSQVFVVRSYWPMPR